MADSVIVDGVEYVRKTSVSGSRRVVVIDGGWIYAGDLTENGDRLYLDRVVMVCRWTGGQWFAGVLADPNTDTILRSVPHRIEVPIRSVLYTVVVPDSWGL